MNKTKLKILFKDVPTLTSQNYWRRDEIKGEFRYAGIDIIYDKNHSSYMSYHEDFDTFSELSLEEMLPYVFVPNHAVGQCLHVFTLCDDSKRSSGYGWGSAAYVKRYNRYRAVELLGKYLVLKCDFRHTFKGNGATVYFAFTKDKDGNIIKVDDNDKELEAAISTAVTVMLITGE